MLHQNCFVNYRAKSRFVNIVFQSGRHKTNAGAAVLMIILVAQTSYNISCPISLPAVVDDLYHYVHPVTKQPVPLISEEIYDIITRHSEVGVCQSGPFIKLGCTSSCEVLLPFSAPQLCHYLRQGLQLSVLWIQGVCVDNSTCTCKELWVSCLVHCDGLVPCAISSCVSTILAVTEYDSVPSPTQQRCLRYFCDTSIVGMALHTETLYG